MSIQKGTFQKTRRLSRKVHFLELLNEKLVYDFSSNSTKPMKKVLKFVVLNFKKLNWSKF